MKKIQGKDTQQFFKAPEKFPRAYQEAQNELLRRKLFDESLG